MADGKLIQLVPDYPAQSSVPNMNFVLIDAAVGADSGQWIPFTPFSRAAIEVTGSSSARSVQICGSNAADIPLNADDGSTIGSAITTESMTLITMPCRWIKAKVTSVTGGDVSVTINAVAP